MTKEHQFSNFKRHLATEKLKGFIDVQNNIMILFIQGQA